MTSPSEIEKEEREGNEGPQGDRLGREGDGRVGEVELSVVLPCLNESETIETCVEKALGSLEAHGIDGEVVVADNGSDDGSREIARAAGARVVEIAEKGYGAALQGGIESAKGQYVVMADADDSYALETVHEFYEKLEEGYDLVMGNRFEGGIEEGAMPFLHRYLGNPVLSWIGRLFFGSEVGDFHCGLRGFDREKILELDLRTTGMEFASELVIKAELHDLEIAEIPTVLRPDGRTDEPHLNTWRDGWRHLRFLLLYQPRWLFMIPGGVLMLAGLVLLGWVYTGSLKVGPVSFAGVHSMMYAALAMLVGYQGIAFGVFSKFFAVNEGLLPDDPTVKSFHEWFTLERGVTVGSILSLAGLAGAVYAFVIWSDQAFGALDPKEMFRIVIPSFLGLAIGVQTVFSSFFISVLDLKHR